MKNSFTLLITITALLVPMQISLSEYSDNTWRAMLFVGVVHLLYFQIWIIKKWRTLSSHNVTTGLWLISLINIADIGLCTYSFFDLSIILPS